jgi:hypothetical protein
MLLLLLIEILCPREPYLLKVFHMKESHAEALERMCSSCNRMTSTDSKADIVPNFSVQVHNTA